MGDDYLLFDRRSNRWIGDNPPHRRKLGWSPPNDGHHFCVPVDARLGGLAWSSSGDSVNCDAQSAPSSIRMGSPEEYFLSGRYFDEGRDRDCYLREFWVLSIAALRAGHAKPKTQNPKLFTPCAR